MPHPTRIFRPLLMVCATLLALYAAVGLGTRWWLDAHPGMLAGLLASGVHQATGLQCTVDDAHVTIFPLPAVAADNLRLQGPRFSAQCSYASIGLNLPALCRGRILPASVSLLRPRLMLHVDSGALPALPASSSSLRAQRDEAQAGDAHARPQDPASSFPLPDMRALSLPSLPFDCVLEILQGECTAQAGDGTSLTLSGMDADIRLHAPYGVAGSLRIGAASYCSAGHCIASAVGITLESEGDILHMPQGSPGMLRASFLLHPAASLPPLHTAATLRQTADSSAPLLELDIRNAPGDAHPPFLLNLHAAARWTPPRLALETCSLHMDENRAELRGTLDIATPQQPRFAGKVEVDHLSLTQWFGFGRALPPGLQAVLHDISGSMYVEADETGLKASDLRAVAGGMQFTGSGGVPSWSAPVITLDAATESADLGTILPESLGVFPAAPSYSHDPLLPAASAESSPEQHGTSLSYDIRLHAGKLRYGPLDSRDAAFRVSPAGEKVRLDLLLGGFYGGRGRGTLLLSEERNTTTYDIDCALERIDSGKLGAALGLRNPGLPGGLASASATLRGQGSTGAAFLRTLTGTAAVTAQAGTLPLPATSGQKTASLPHQGGRLSLALRSAALEGRQLVLNGRWETALRTASGTLDASGEGRVLIGAQSVRLAGIPVRAQLHASPSSLLPRGAQAAVEGTLSLDSARKTCALTRAKLTACGMTASGDWHVRQEANGLPHVSGTLRWETSSLRRSLEALGYPPPPTRNAGMLGRATLHAGMDAGPSQLSLSDLACTLDATSTSGSLTIRREGGGLSVTGELRADTVDADAYRTTASGRSDGSAQKKPWNLRPLRDGRASLNITIGTLRLAKCALRNVRLPVRLAEGRLSTDMQATLYGGPLRAALRATAEQNGLRASVDASVRQCDLLAASRDRRLSSDIAGSGGAQATLSALIRSGADLPGRLEGSWQLSASNGYYQARKNGHPSGARTSYASFTASGVVEKGVVKSSNVLLRGPSLNLSGGGWINLDKETLRGDFTVTLPPLPSAPMTVSGTLENPRTSIHAGKALVNGLEKIGSGLLDAAGGLMDDALKLLR